MLTASMIPVLSVSNSSRAGSGPWSGLRTYHDKLAGSARDVRFEGRRLGLAWPEVWQTPAF